MMHKQMSDGNNRSEHFKLETDSMLECPCCGLGTPSISILMLLEAVRAEFGRPVIVTSGPRCKKHNAQVGGAEHSRHIVTKANPESDAVDFIVKGVSGAAVRKFIKTLPYAHLISLGAYGDRTHADTRGENRKW